MEDFPTALAGIIDERKIKLDQLQNHKWGELQNMIQRKVLVEAGKAGYKLEYTAEGATYVAENLRANGLIVHELKQLEGECDCTMSYGCNHPDPPAGAREHVVGYIVKWGGF
jgi:hypothetical protein